MKDMKMINLAQLQGNQFNTLSTLRTLINAKSITPNDAGSIEWISKHLLSYGFSIETFEVRGVKNLIASYVFGDGPKLGFLGHVDVVPAPLNGWKADPFSGEIIDGYIYGRGAADMKGGIAAMLTATERLMTHSKQCKGSLYWLITSDEEGEAEFGSKEIARHLSAQNIILDACLVGEPTADEISGDVIKNGRRGALSGCIKIIGKAGHVAYPNNAINAAHTAAQVIDKIISIDWEKDGVGSQTGLQVTGLEVQNSVDNVIPNNCQIRFNVRYSHNYDSRAVVASIEEALASHESHIQYEWERPCESYYTGSKQSHCFLELVERSVHEVTGHFPQLTTNGGTSDGRFFSSNQTQVIECGVCNSTIHQVNERVALDDLARVETIYFQILKNYFIRNYI